MGHLVRDETAGIKAVEDAYYRFENAITALQNVWRNGHTTHSVSLVIDEMVEERDALRHELRTLRKGR